MRKFTFNIKLTLKGVRERAREREMKKTSILIFLILIGTIFSLEGNPGGVGLLGDCSVDVDCHYDTNYPGIGGMCNVSSSKCVCFPSNHGLNCNVFADLVWFDELNNKLIFNISFVDYRDLQSNMLFRNSAPCYYSVFSDGDPTGTPREVFPIDYFFLEDYASTFGIGATINFGENEEYNDGFALGFRWNMMEVNLGTNYSTEIITPGEYLQYLVPVHNSGLPSGFPQFCYNYLFPGPGPHNCSYEYETVIRISSMPGLRECNGELPGPTACSGHGECVWDEDCLCEEFYTAGEWCEINQCDGPGAEGCNDQGDCIEHNNCTCADPSTFIGEYCHVCVTPQTFGPFCNLSCTCENGGICTTSEDTCNCTGTDMYGPLCNLNCTCENGGFCPTTDEAFCDCTGTYMFGSLCEIACTCENGGVCTTNETTCNCTGTDMYGPLCNLNCTCENGGFCPTTDEAFCDCTGTYMFGSLCEIACTCENGGVCTTNETTCNCTGTESFGTLCDLNCTCENGGICTTDEATCDCTGTYMFGSLCEIACTCENGGVCTTNETTCNCTGTESFGTLCNLNCTCENGGICTTDEATCDCTGTYMFGSLCEIACSCENGGVCTTNETTCDCTETELFGTLCTINCTCENGGVCTTDEATCDCTGTGLVGPLCNTSCTCENGGICTTMDEAICDCTGTEMFGTLCTVNCTCENGGACTTNETSCDCTGTEFLGYLCRTSIYNPFDFFTVLIANWIYFTAGFIIVASLYFLFLITVNKSNDDTIEIMTRIN